MSADVAGLLTHYLHYANSVHHIGVCARNGHKTHPILVAVVVFHITLVHMTVRQ